MLNVDDFKPKTDLIDVEVLDKTDVSNNVETTVPENLSGIIDLKLLVEDYKNLRNLVLANTATSKKVLDSLTIEMFANEVCTPEMVSSYSTLLKTINDSMKLMTNSYKEISDVLLNIHKINTIDKPKDVKVKNVNIISSAEVLDRLMKEN
nr:MAG TPA: Terminase DNA packaging enzyme small [Caudoviricetes sp.]